MVSNFGGSLLALGLVSSARGTAPAYWYSVPNDFQTVSMQCTGGKCGFDESNVHHKADGPKFAANVYYELDGAYDKRVIYTSYVQTMKEGCNDPRDCDGLKGANEFDMIETGFVGYNNTWFINDNKRCLTHFCNAQSTCGSNGCSWAAGSCRVGDYNGCNSQTASDKMPPACTWTDVQNAFSMCTQSAQLDPRNQDFTVLSANGYLHGETGPTPKGCPATAPCSGKFVWDMATASAVSPVNNRRSFQVKTGDDKPWGNRWIRLELELNGSRVDYTYRFFKPGAKDDKSATVTSVQKFSLTSVEGKPVFEADTPHYWVFSLWQYDFEFAVPTNQILDQKPRLHYQIVKDPEDDSTKHVAGGEKAEVLPVIMQTSQLSFGKCAVGFGAAFVTALAVAMALVIRKRSRQVKNLARGTEGFIVPGAIE